MTNAITPAATTTMWWLLLVRGIAMAIFGVLMLAWPGKAVLAMVVVFGIYALVDGFAGLGHMIRTRQWTFLPTVTALTSIAAGVIALVWPGKTALLLLFLLAFWAVVIGVLEVVAALGLRTVPGGGWGWVLVSGLASIVLGILLFINPLGGAIAMLVFVGFFTIFSGVLLVGAAFALRSVAKRVAG